MKVILYMSASVNGYIATESDDVDFVSDASWESYKSRIGESDAVIVGRRTYDLMPKDEFNKNTTYIVITTNPPSSSKVQNIHFLGNVSDAIEMLRKAKRRLVVISGGGKTNAAFAKHNLIDEIYLDIEPTVIGKGIHLFAPSELELTLKLLGTKKLNENTVQLHYEVLKD